jgi:hypothetical protein
MSLSLGELYHIYLLKNPQTMIGSKEVGSRQWQQQSHPMKPYERNRASVEAGKYNARYKHH